MEHLPGRVLITFARFDGRGCLRDADPKARRLTLDEAFGREPSWRIGVLADPFRPHDKRVGSATPIAGRILQIVAMTLFDPRPKPHEIGYFGNGASNRCLS